MLLCHDDDDTAVIADTGRVNLRGLAADNPPV